MEMWTNKDVELWESSPDFLKKKKVYQDEQKKLIKYGEIYTGKQFELEKMCSQQVKFKQYGIGDSTMHRGALCPSKINDFVIGNEKRGRLTKTIGKKQPKYIYYYNEKGKLVKSETTTEYSKTNQFVEYIIYDGNYEIGITYTKNGKLEAISKVLRQNGELVSYQYGNCDIIDGQMIMWEMESERYTYEGKKNVKVDWVILRGEDLRHSIIDVLVDEKGQGISYKESRFIGAKLIDNDEERKITKKIFFYDGMRQENKEVKLNKERNEQKMKNVNKVNIKNCLFERIKTIMENWNDEEDICAISFFLEDCGESEVPLFSISYNTEEYCEGNAENDEECWNYACWSQNEENVIEENEEKLLERV